MVLTKSDFISEVAAKGGFTKKDVKDVLVTMQIVLFDHLAKKDAVKVFDGVTFDSVYKPPRQYLHPKTGELSMGGDKIVPRVKFGDVIKRVVAGEDVKL